MKGLWLLLPSNELGGDATPVASGAAHGRGGRAVVDRRSRHQVVCNREGQAGRIVGTRHVGFSHVVFDIPNRIKIERSNQVETIIFIFKTLSTPNITMYKK